ncbi:LysR substrate-binding domain-containing protein [Flavobacterium sp. DG1-102-2]|uniref:hydrogen peroxide-inducible genes activator n=1 Tax=Flavobacterium sp. DG1-102-2 TaxID=3081663 RepID=UPI0029495D43|nr:LysR substrate-binding domain-containing protein [Flavobacterium sp. DG1-102-2]MDV6166802.1 LysR substrate-binding domain-containing protein [Flavobacterium sp. DG1-102-2]
MTIQQLRYIIALDEHRHFSKAAEVCMVTQPGLTIQLKNLEEEIGIKIFDRTKVPLKPTLLGVEIINRAKKVLHEADSIRNFVVNQKNDLKGEVTLGVISTLSPYLIPQFIKSMRDVVPDMHFNIKETGTGQLLHGLQNGEIDIALMATPTGMPGLREYPVFNEPFVAFLHEGHPLAKADHYEMNLTDKPFLLLLQQEYCYNAQMLDICGMPDRMSNPDEQFNYDINSIETLKNLVRAELGFAIIPELSVLNEKENTLFKPFKDPKPVREISLVTSDTFSRKLLLEKMSHTIWGCLPDKLKEEHKYRKIQWNDSPYFVNATAGFL